MVAAQAKPPYLICPFQPTLNTALFHYIALLHYTAQYYTQNCTALHFAVHLKPF